MHSMDVALWLPGCFTVFFPQFTKEQQTIAEQIGDYPILIMPDYLQMYKLLLNLLLIMALCIFLY